MRPGGPPARRGGLGAARGPEPAGWDRFGPGPCADRLLGAVGAAVARGRPLRRAFGAGPPRAPQCGRWQRAKALYLGDLWADVAHPKIWPKWTKVDGSWGPKAIRRIWSFAATVGTFGAPLRHLRSWPPAPRLPKSCRLKACRVLEACRAPFSAASVRATDSARPSCCGKQGASCRVRSPSKHSPPFVPDVRCCSPSLPGL